MERTEWYSLNGFWQFSIDAEARWTHPRQVSWDQDIQVPFAPETPASGVGRTDFFRACWYRRTFTPPRLSHGGRLMLHFGAVDYAAMVWVNGQRVARHVGGYTPFSADITDALVDGEQELVVWAKDDPKDLEQPRGKQDWQLTPHAIWYPRTTGIWQTVWLEPVPAVSIERVRWMPSLERWDISFDASLSGVQEHANCQLRVRLTIDGELLADDVYTVVAGEVHRRIALSDPGIDDYRNELLWRPNRPRLIDAELTLTNADGIVLDRVRSYTALRSVGVQADRFILNGRSYQLRMVLDQGYWPKTGLTAPDDEALKRDVELIKAMGFNGVRLHQKIEDPRFLYWADRLGLLVWEEMPSAYRFTRRSVERLTSEWLDVLDRDASHPCIVAWVPFNESWGVPDLPSIAEQRHYVQALYHLTKTIDPSRPVIGNDGWESVATDIIGIHDYDDDDERLSRRYSVEEAIKILQNRERPGGRLLTLEGYPHTGQPIILTEFGGIIYAPGKNGAWGYSRVETSEELAERYKRLVTAVQKLPTLAGFCYTQFTDTYQEANGLLFFDRTPKFPIAQIAEVTRRPRGAWVQESDLDWRDRLMELQRLIPTTGPEGM